MEFERSSWKKIEKIIFDENDSKQFESNKLPMIVYDNDYIILIIYRICSKWARTLKWIRIKNKHGSVRKMWLFYFGINKICILFIVRYLCEFRWNEPCCRRPSSHFFSSFWFKYKKYDANATRSSTVTNLQHYETQTEPNASHETILKKRTVAKPKFELKQLWANSADRPVSWPT